MQVLAQNAMLKSIDLRNQAGFALNSPICIYDLCEQNRQNLFDRYIKAFPRIKALASPKNRRGIYFERLIAFGAGTKNGNHLEYIISQLNNLALSFAWRDSAAFF